MDGVQLPQGYNHFEEAIYFLPFSSQKFLVLFLHNEQRPFLDRHSVYVSSIALFLIALDKNGPL